MSSNLVETLIGAVVIGVAAVFLAFAYSNVGPSTGGSYELKASFNRVDGLATGADVRISGIKVGSVTGQSLDPVSFRATIHMTMANDIELPDDSSAKIASEGLLGGSYVAIEPGGSDKNLIHGAEIKYTQGSVDVMGLISRAVFGSADGTAPAGTNP